MRYMTLVLAAAVAIAVASAPSAHAQTQPQFVQGFKTLADLIPDIVGQPIENQHFDPQTGNALQQTTNGLLVWYKSSNLTEFTNGSTTWILGPFGLQSRPNNTRFPWELATPSPSPSTSPVSPHPGNWAGYALPGFSTGQSYTSVAGTWTVPTVQVPPGLPFGFAASWVGVGGYCVDSQCSGVDPTLIQVGTEQDAVTGGTQYFAWYEMLPFPPVVIGSLTINPGDTINASLQMASGNPGGPQTWQIKLTDATSGQSFSQTVQYTSSLASAEWIVEAPFARSVLPLANFGTLTFDLGTANGANPNLPGAQGIVMVNPRGQTSNVSAPDSDADGFNACWGTGSTLTPCSPSGS